MNAKKILAAGAAVVAGAALAVPEVSNVTMVQPSGSRLVTITYDLLNEDAVVTLDVQTNATVNGETVWTSIGGAAISGTVTGKTAGGAKGDVWKKVTAGNGKSITWRPDLTWPDHKIADGGARAVVTAWALDNTPDYMAVDISSGARQNTQNYYPGADFVPGGVTNDEYKTSTLLMRKIMAKGVQFNMGSTGAETQRPADGREATHKVTLTNNYYIGVYEVTQSQWYEITGYNNSNFTGSMRPVEMVNYNEPRIYDNSTAGASSMLASYSWPNEPSSESFLGKLKNRTGIYFDLPSEAQWEFAARAGHGSGYWNDGTEIMNSAADANLDALGRYKNSGSSTNSTDSAGGTAIVGSYKPNDWGLYDMHGNVYEWVLDWYQQNIATATDVNGEDYNGRVNINPSDPTKTLSGSSVQYRVGRGGSWNDDAENCRPARRGYRSSTNRLNEYGVRVVCTAGLE